MPPSVESELVRPPPHQLEMWLSSLLHDLGDEPIVRIEELRIRLRPPSQISDGEETRGLRVIELAENLRQDRAVPLLTEDPLRFWRAQEVDEGLGLLGIRGLGHDGDRVLGERSEERRVGKECRSR